MPKEIQKFLLDHNGEGFVCEECAEEQLSCVCGECELQLLMNSLPEHRETVRISRGHRYRGHDVRVVVDGPESVVKE